MGKYLSFIKLRAFTEMRQLIVILAYLIMIVSPSVAQDFRKGIEAYKAGDYTTAIREWWPLAMTGDPGAQFLLGATYDYGHGVIQDNEEAATWYRLAAEQGHSSAQYYIGFMYESGRGVPQDNTIAYMWFNIAASNLSEVGRENRDLIAKKMIPSAISKAKELATECIASNYKKCGY